MAITDLSYIFVVKHIQGMCCLFGDVLHKSFFLGLSMFTLTRVHECKLSMQASI